MTKCKMDVHIVQHEIADLDSALMDYLYEFGNTREADLIKALEKEGFRERTIKKHLPRLEKDGKIHAIFHTKLRPVAVYYSVHKEHIPLEIQKEIIRANAQMTSAELAAYGHG